MLQSLHNLRDTVRVIASGSRFEAHIIKSTTCKALPSTIDNQLELIRAIAEQSLVRLQTVQILEHRLQSGNVVVQRKTLLLLHLLLQVDDTQKNGFQQTACGFGPLLNRLHDIAMCSHERGSMNAT